MKCVCVCGGGGGGSEGGGGKENEKNEEKNERKNNNGVIGPQSGEAKLVMANSAEKKRLNVSQSAKKIM